MQKIYILKFTYYTFIHHFKNTQINHTPEFLDCICLMASSLYFGHNTVYIH